MMPSRVGQMRRGIRRLAKTSVKLHWQERTGGTADPVYGTVTGGTVETLSETQKMLVHWPDLTRSEVRQFTEIAQGDCIVDLADADVEFEGRTGLEFEIAGRRYRPKPASDRLLKAWDVVVGDVKLTRSLLLTPSV
jgi:hypothetical protein